MNRVPHGLAAAPGQTRSRRELPAGSHGCPRQTALLRPRGRGHRAAPLGPAALRGSSTGAAAAGGSPGLAALPVPPAHARVILLFRVIFALAL